MRALSVRTHYLASTFILRYKYIICINMDDFRREKLKQQKMYERSHYKQQANGKSSTNKK